MRYIIIIITVLLLAACGGGGGGGSSGQDQDQDRNLTGADLGGTDERVQTDLAVLINGSQSFRTHLNRAGTVTSLVVTVTNLGDQTCSVPFDVDVREIRHDDEYNYEPDEHWSCQVTAALAPGETWTYERIVTVPVGTSAAFVATIDYDDGYEENNRADSSYNNITIKHNG